MQYIIINKYEQKKINICYNPTDRNLIANYGKNYKDYLIVPIELFDKEVIVINDIVLEKPLDIQALKQQAIEFLTTKIEDRKKEKFVIQINKADETFINVQTDLQDSTINQWLVVKNKISKDFQYTKHIDSGDTIVTTQVKYAPVLNSETNLNEFIPLTDDEILRLNTFLTNSVDILTHTIINITNIILTATDELVIQVYNMTSEEKDAYIQQLIEQNTP